MPVMDWDHIEEADFAVLPPGRYKAKVADIDTHDDDGEMQTQNGDLKWRIHFQVIGGDYDHQTHKEFMAFSPKAIGRIKTMCRALGIHVTGSINLNTGMLIGKVCYIIIEPDTWQKRDGTFAQSAKIAFSGFESVSKAPSVGAPVTPTTAPTAAEEARDADEETHEDLKDYGFDGEYVPF